MRISTNMTFDNFIFHQQRLSRDLFKGQIQLSTGKEVNVLSDNPLQASRILKLSSAEEQQQQVIENIRFASDFLNAADAAMASVSNLLIRVNELASGAVNSIALPAEREAAAIEVQSITNELSTIANQQYLGLYLFGGRDVENRPVIGELGGIHYVGDTGDLMAHIAENSDGEFNLTADDVFGMLSSRVSGHADLDPALSLETRLDELLGANKVGIRLGSLRFVEDGPAGTYNVDLTEANSVGQIIDLINASALAAGSTLTAGIKAAGDGLLITPGDTVTISELDNNVAGDLGIATNGATSDPIVGLDLNRVVTNTTLIADLLGGTGIDFTDNTFLIRNGDFSASINLSAAETIQDILNTINNTGIGVRASINEGGNGIDVLNEVSGTIMTIEEEGGTAATTLGLRSLITSTRLDDLNFGKGVSREEGEDDLRIVAKDGTTLDINLDTAETIQDVLDLINDAAEAAAVTLEASLTTTGNGIRIVDSTGGAGALQITGLNLSLAIDDLGLDGFIDPAATETVGTDVHGVRVEGVFGALLALSEALLQGDERDITEAAGRVDDAHQEATQVRGMVGAQVRAMETRADQTQQAVDATSILLSQVQDLDLAEAITKFQQAQTSLQASLLASGQSLDLTLLNFLG